MSKETHEKEWDEYKKLYENYVGSGDIIRTDEIECEHESKEYVGIVDRFNYCIKCNVKMEAK